jgi:hypothetical protein
VRGPIMACLSTGPAGGSRTAAFCLLPDGRNLSCAMLDTGTVVLWESYWRDYPRCPRRR